LEAVDPERRQRSLHLRASQGSTPIDFDSLARRAANDFDDEAFHPKFAGVLTARLSFVLLILLAVADHRAGAAPIILEQPRPVLARVGESIDFSVVATGEEHLNYTWYSERKALANGTGPSFVLESVAETDAGIYWVVVSNKWGRVGSDGALLRVATPREWPESSGGNGHRYEFIRIGQPENDWNMTFKDVMASGGYLVSYHSRAEEDFANSLAPLSITRLIGLIQPPGSPEPAGGWRWMSGEPFFYSRWAAGEPNNAAVNLRGFENLVGVNSDGTWNDIHGGGRGYIIEFPKDLIIYNNLSNVTRSGYETVALTAGAASKGPLQYQWFANGRALRGSKSNVLEVSTALTNPGPYSFVVGDGISILTSTTADVRMGPFFVSSPKTSAHYIGDPAQFDVTVAGPGPFEFQWYRNDSPLPGENGTTLRIANIRDSDAGSYWVMVSNTNATTSSAPGELIVVHPTSSLVLLDDFESGSHSGWSLPLTTLAPAGGRRFLGEFKSESINLVLTNLPPHSELEISCDVIIRGYWQGNGRPDTWRIAIDGRSMFLTTFSTFTTQAFPGTYPGSSNPRAAGARETNNFGYELSFADNMMLEDARFRVTATATHTNTTGTLTFSASLGSPNEAGWSLDNVAVATKSQLASRMQVLVAGNSEVRVEITAEPGLAILLQASNDLIDWTTIQPLVLSSGKAVLDIPMATPSRFLRVVSDDGAH
jgi:hypothetical protein